MPGIGRISLRQAGYEIREINNLSAQNGLHNTDIKSATTTKFKNYVTHSPENLPLTSRLPTLFILALGLTAIVLLLRQKLLWQGVYSLPADQDLGF